MKQNKLKILWTMSLSVILLASCGSSDAKKWSYSKEDMSDFMSLEAQLDHTSDNECTFTADTEFELFNKELTAKDIIVFDIDEAKKNLSSSNKAYADYSVLKSASLPVTGIETDKDLGGFEVSFTANGVANYGMLINSSATVENAFLMVTKHEDESKTIYTDPQAEFEENYVKGKMNWEEGVKFAYQMVSNIASLVIGIYTGQPTAISGGIFGILGALGENFWSSGATIKDVMDKLNEIDNKIDRLSAKIDRNTQQLADEIVRAEAMVDQANLNTLNIAINDFATTCLAPINDINRNLADEVGAYYKNYIKSSQTVDLLLTKNSDNNYESTPLGDLTGTTNFSLTISNFPNASAHLAAHSNIVEEGFMGELDKDVDAAIAAKTDLPEGINKEDLRSFVTSMIYEQFTKQYYSANPSEAQNYRNKVISLAQRISGAAGTISILSSYVSRLQYMYNFASEIKDNVRTLCANLMQVLDFNTARAASACLFAEITSTELSNVFKTTREYIQTVYENVTKTPDTYSFTTSATLSGGFYYANYNISYSNPGNDCSLNIKFEMDDLKLAGLNIEHTPTSISSHYSLSGIQHARIATRWGLLVSSGTIDYDGDYIHYLADVGVVPHQSVEAAEYLMSLRQALSSCYRILTSDRNERELNSNDTSTWIYCVAQGNPDGEYFTYGKGYGYRENHTASCWAGRIFESSFVDAATGTSAGTQRIAMWARYAESHWYWIDDEYWAFSNIDNTNYFFSVDIVTE